MDLGTAQSPRARLNALTGLRFFAAMYVVLYHVVPEHFTSMPTVTASVVGSGYVAVSLFFVLSGYILAYNYVPDPANPSVNRRKFWGARAARIYPVYAFSLALALPYFILLETHKPWGAWTRLYDGARTVGLSAVMLQAWVPSLAYRFNGPSWSLSAEAFFYLLFPALVPLVCRTPVRRHPIVVCLLLWLLSIAGLTGMSRFAHTHLGIQLLTRGGWAAALVYMPVFRIPEFLVGVVLGVAHSDRSITISAVGARTLTLGSLALLLALLADAHALPALLMQTGLLVPVFAALILGLAASDGPVARMFSWPSLVLLGEASYSVYILHAPLHTWLRGLDLLDGGRLYASPLWVPVYVGFVVLVSIYVLRKVEIPARAVLRQWFTPGVHSNRILGPEISAPESSIATARSVETLPA